MMSMGINNVSVGHCYINTGAFVAEDESIENRPRKRQAHAVWIKETCNLPMWIKELL